MELEASLLYRPLLWHLMGLMLVDCHSHLTHKYYEDKLEAVLDRARKAGVKRIICSGVNTPTNREVLALVKKYPDIIHCTLGLYPTELLGMGADEAGLSTQKGTLDLDEEFAFIAKNKEHIVGIGEVGMDYKWDKTRHEEQKKHFARILEHVKKLNLPVVIHSRNAESDCLDILEASGLKKVMLHCFSGKKSLVKRAIDLGYYISIPAVSKKLQHFQMVAEMTPLAQLLTETDAPWLTPYPESYNEPSFIIESIKVIAKAKGMTEEESSLQVFKNYMDLFGR